jgi:hypothetical protein
MKSIHFSFKREAAWIMVFSFAPLVIGALLLLLSKLIQLLTNEKT